MLPLFESGRKVSGTLSFVLAKRKRPRAPERKSAFAGALEPYAGGLFEWSSLLVYVLVHRRPQFEPHARLAARWCVSLGAQDCVGAVYCAAPGCGGFAAGRRLGLARTGVDAGRSAVMVSSEASLRLPLGG